MSALPMLERCFWRQWCGLSNEERARLDAGWAREYPSPRLWRVCITDYSGIPLWQVDRDTEVLTLIAIKED